MAGLALALLTPGLALAEGGPTPEPTHPVPVNGHTLNIGRNGDRVSWWIKNDPKSPPIDVGKVQVVISNTYGPMTNPASCADGIVKTNVSNVETEAAARARLKMNSSSILFSSARLITIPEARMWVDLINECALKAKQVISTLLPTITTISPSKVAPPTVMATRTPASSTPVKLPATTSTPQAEVPSKTDTRENIKYVLGGALVLALLGLGSLAALVAHNSKNNEKKDEPNQVKLRRLPNETTVDDQRVLPLTGQGRIPFKVYMGDGKRELPVTFEPRVLVIDANDSNLLQRVLGALARAIKREDPSIVRAKATALMHHEGGHGENTSEGVFILGVIRDQNTDEIIGAAVKDLNANATPEQRRKMSLGPQEPSEHDKRNARLAEEEMNKKKK